MLLRSAMRYYRLWIYSCNGVLLLSVLVFVAVGSCFLADVRMRFVPLALYHPTLLYGYVALILQAGVLQAIGCVSAIRLNERWLNLYWLLMLVLLVGDVIVGLAWVFLFSSLKAGIPTHLKHRLHAEYGVESERSTLWDRFQQENQCCGSNGPVDYNDTAWLNNLPQSQLSPLNDTTWSSSFRYILLGSHTWMPVPVSCCRSIVGSKNTTKSPCWSQGCAEPLRQWVQRSADVLFILGYCIIAFLKLCFLGILRYEIREMIQKIRLLQGELQALPDLAAIGMPSPNHVTATSSDADKMMTPNGNNNDIEMKEMVFGEARL